MQKTYSPFFRKNMSVYAIFNDQSFNKMLINDNITFKQLGPGDPFLSHNKSVKYQNLSSNTFLWKR